MPARRTDDRDGWIRRWSGYALHVFLVCLVPTAALALYRGAIPGVGQPFRASIFVKFNDHGLRQLATTAPTPIYPPTSLANGVSGVVVATVTISLEGRVMKVRIVESPDAATGRAVKDALTQWAFRPLKVPTAANVITGDMIFYFHVRDGQGMVLSADERQAIDGVTRSPEERRESEPVVTTIDESAFSGLTRTAAPVVLDIRSRAAYLESHREGAVNIPLRELQTRDRELPAARLVVIDCFAEQQQSGLCGMAVHLLTSHGFGEIAVLNRGAR